MWPEGGAACVCVCGEGAPGHQLWLYNHSLSAPTPGGTLDEVTTPCWCWRAGTLQFDAKFYPNTVSSLHIMVLGNKHGLLFHPLTSFWEEQFSFPETDSQNFNSPEPRSWCGVQSERPDVLGRASCLDRHCEELKTLRWDPHMQSLTLIINYGCFCYFLPQPFTTKLLAVRKWG